MKNIVKGRGKIKYHTFKGVRWVGVGLVFADKESARDARSTLGEGWEPAGENQNGLLWYGIATSLKDVLDELAPYGKPVANGQHFDVTVPVVPGEQEAFEFAK